MAADVGRGDVRPGRRRLSNVVTLITKPSAECNGGNRGGRHRACFVNVVRSDGSVARGTQLRMPRPHTPAELAAGRCKESEAMPTRIIRFFPVAVAIALTAGAVTEAAAQDTTRSRTPVTSSRRIPVQKEGTTVTESPGAISRDSAARADSIAAAERARQDSIANAERARQDSIAAAERARQEELARIERARQDSIARAEQARRDSIAAAERAREERFQA